MVECMEKKLKEILLSLTSDDLCAWSNARFVARGKLYLSCAGCAG